MPSRRWMWVRPTPHIYAYNRELSSFSGASSAATSSASQAVASYRSARASSEAVQERNSMARSIRASSVAPAGSSLLGYTGYYGRQLALHRQAEDAAKSERKTAAAAASATATAAAAASKASSSSATSAQVATSMSAARESRSNVSMSAKSTTVKKTVEKEESHYEAHRVQLMKLQEKSLTEGRQSMSRAVRRAEAHAESSGRDPRHVGVPRDTSDDIMKKIADIHMTPYDAREMNAARAALAQGHLKIERMEKELSAITQSAMKYQTLYSKSAAQMAKEAMEAAEMEAQSSKKTRKTVVEETKRSRVAAA